MTVVRDWWRRERRALLLLPVAVVLVALASASRLDDYWWSQDFHQRASTSDGWTQIRDRYDDGFLTYPIDADVRLVGIERVDPAALPDDLPAVRIADDAALWRVDTSWRADPEISMVGCNLAIVGSDGTVWAGGSSGWEGSSLALTDRCVPDDTYGPRPELGSSAAPALPAGEQPRPSTWDKSTYLVTARDAEPASIRIWWFLPRYAELPVGS